MSTLPWLAWQGGWALVLAALLAAEIVLTLTDFVVEDTVRRFLGGVYQGERVMHAVMGLMYGAMLAYLTPRRDGVVGGPDRTQCEPSGGARAPTLAPPGHGRVASCCPGSVMSTPPAACHTGPGPGADAAPRPQESGARDGTAAFPPGRSFAWPGATIWRGECTRGSTRSGFSGLRECQRRIIPRSSPASGW